ncbi:hypothetical protein JCM11641_006999 [Rhodosporidiobolus odoratus]
MSATQTLLLRPAPAATTVCESPPASTLVLTQPEFTTPPPGALVFHHHVHRYPPKPLSKVEQWQIYYSGSMAIVTLEPWESWLVHSLFLLLILLTYLTLSRLFSPSTLTGFASRMRFYLFGLPSNSISGSSGMSAVSAAAAGYGAQEYAGLMRLQQGAMNNRTGT